MAILNQEEFFNRLHERLGTDTSDESITFMEDMTDTYNDLVKRANDNNGDWERKYHELDESWKAKYKHRFFSGSNGGNPNYPMGNNDDGSEEDTYDPESVTFKNLFKK